MSDQPAETPAANLYRLTPGQVEMILAMVKTIPFSGTVDQLPLILAAVNGLRKALARPVSDEELRPIIKAAPLDWAKEQT